VPFSTIANAEVPDRYAALTDLNAACLACVLRSGPHWAAFEAKTILDHGFDLSTVSEGVEGLLHGTFRSFVLTEIGRKATEAVLMLVGRIILRAVPLATTEMSWMLWQPRLVTYGPNARLLYSIVQRIKL